MSNTTPKISQPATFKPASLWFPCSSFDFITDCPAAARTFFSYHGNPERLAAFALDRPPTDNPATGFDLFIYRRRHGCFLTKRPDVVNSICKCPGDSALQNEIARKWARRQNKGICQVQHKPGGIRPAPVETLHGFAGCIQTPSVSATRHAYRQPRI